MGDRWEIDGFREIASSRAAHRGLLHPIEAGERYDAARVLRRVVGVLVVHDRALVAQAEVASDPIPCLPCLRLAPLRNVHLMRDAISMPSERQSEVILIEQSPPRSH